MAQQPPRLRAILQAWAEVVAGPVRGRTTGEHGLGEDLVDGREILHQKDG